MKEKFNLWESLGNRRLEDLSPEERAVLDAGMRKNHRTKLRRDRNKRLTTYLKNNALAIIATAIAIAAFIKSFFG